MPKYLVPLDDYGFLYDLLGLNELTELSDFDLVTKDVAMQIVEEAGKFSGEVLQPLNRDSDEIGARFKNGNVEVPPGFIEAYKQFCDAGWIASSGPTEFGGQGLPSYLAFALTESASATCISFIQYTSLSKAAVMAIEGHAEKWLKDLYLPKLVSGEWSGTMCLTESHAGTDLGLMRTKAELGENDIYRITGTKVFISAGEHNLTDNIVHLVLARLPDAPAGVKGISLFIVPKFVPGCDGSVEERNHVHCGSIERKMGMKGSVACVMNFDAAKGWMVGKPHKGLHAMFTMMNVARLSASAQGPGIAEAVYQSSVNYAAERLQGRSLSGVKCADKPADPLLVHPDIRRMLLQIKVHSDGGRAFGLWVAKHVDIAFKHPDPKVRAEASAFVSLMTPVAKAWTSDAGVEAANLGMQIFGGHGYIREWGMEQLLRDIRLVPLYEGANGIQALDLVARKLPMEAGNMLKHLTNPIDEYIARGKKEANTSEFLEFLISARAILEQATKSLAKGAANNPDELGAASVDYLRIVGYVTQAFLWIRMGDAALERHDENPKFFDRKIACARFFFAKMLPFANAHLTSLETGAVPVMALAGDSF